LNVSQGSTHHNFHADWKRAALGGTCPPPSEYWCDCVIYITMQYLYVSSPYLLVFGDDRVRGTWE